MSNLDNAFVGIENANPTEKLPHLRPGVYVLEVKALKYIPNSRKGALSIAEFEVVEAQGEGANEPGTSASHVIKMSLESALGNVRGLVAAVSNTPVKSVSRKDCVEAFGADNPAKGVKVDAEAFVTKTKAGTDFTLISYAPYESTSMTTSPAKGAMSATAAPATKAAKK
jgi:hypothetical protein